MAEPTGLEPAISGVTVRYVNQLHHGSAWPLTGTQKLQQNDPKATWFEPGPGRARLEPPHTIAHPPGPIRRFPVAPKTPALGQISPWRGTWACRVPPGVAGRRGLWGFRRGVAHGAILFLYNGPMDDLRVCDDISEAVGWTPLLRLQRCMQEFDCEAFAKLEFLNPVGSVKDRLARFLVDQAMQAGELNVGDTIVEASSGNTAMALGMMATLRGLQCKIVVRKQTSPEKLDCLRAIGVDLVLVDGDLPPDHPESYNRKAVELAESSPGVWFPDQHNNRLNNEAHYRTTGPEIWKQMGGKIDILVAGIGTGGTISGVARYLKEQDPAIRVVAVDVVGSVFSEYFRSGKHGEPTGYMLEGLGDEEIIDCPEFELIDDMVQVEDGVAFRACRELLRSEAVMAGGSSGAAYWGIREVAASVKPGTRIVTVFPDSGTRYLKTLYNDDWMRKHGFLD